MNINFSTKYYKTRELKDKDYHIFKAVDTAAVECYTFFVNKEVMDTIASQEKGSPLVINGYVKYEGKTAKCYLKNVYTADGDVIYEYSK